jgi:alkanesulfonate monooxygenase SsuD/methylene tetrahydromethanopterin reductase-like flavin-dependent oxidoreductase (luciferase family)
MKIGIGWPNVVIPLRDTARPAKQAASIDRLSGGRLTLGVGIVLAPGSADLEQLERIAAIAVPSPVLA